MESLMTCPSFLDLEVMRRKTLQRNRVAWNPTEFLQSCQECINAFKKRPSDWFFELCSEPHMVVWARCNPQRFWPAKLISISDDGRKATLFIFGARRVITLPVNYCLLFCRKDPNTTSTMTRNWILALFEVYHYLQLLAKRYGCFSYAKAYQLLEGTSIAEVRKVMLPAVFDVQPSRGPLPASNAEPPTPAAKRMRRCTHSDNAAQGSSTRTEPPRRIATEEAYRTQIATLKSELAYERDRYGRLFRRTEHILLCQVCEFPAVCICCHINYYCSQRCFMLDSHRRFCGAQYRPCYSSAVLTKAVRNWREPAVSQFPVPVWPSGSGGYNTVPTIHAFAARPQQEQRMLFPYATSAIDNGRIMRPMPVNTHYGAAVAPEPRRDEPVAGPSGSAKGSRSSDVPVNNAAATSSDSSAQVQPQEEESDDDNDSECVLVIDEDTSESSRSRMFVSPDQSSPGASASRQPSQSGASSQPPTSAAAKSGEVSKKRRLSF